MNKYNVFCLFAFLFLCLFTACQSKTDGQVATQSADTLTVRPAKAPTRLQVSSYQATLVSTKIR